VNKIEVETDSNGISIIELLHLKKNDYEKIVKLMLCTDVSNLGYQSRIQAGAKISWFDNKNHSISIFINNSCYMDFIKHLNLIVF